jgi:hypothetical protein
MTHRTRMCLIEFIDLVLRDASFKPRSVALVGCEERNPLNAIHGHRILLLLDVVIKVIKFRAAIVLNVSVPPFEYRRPITT